MSDFLNSDELANLIRLHPLTVAQWRSRGVGPPYIRVGRRVRYARLDVELWLAQHRQVPELELSDPAVTLSS